MTELILMLLALTALSINVCMVFLIFKMLFCREKTAADVLVEEISEQRRKEMEQQELLQQGLDNIMSYDGSPNRKERDAR